MSKVSTRFYNAKEVRAVWDEATEKWWFSAVDVVAAINKENNYKKAQNYWYYIKNKDKSAQFLSNTKQLKMTADREMFMKGIDYSYYYEQPE